MLKIQRAANAQVVVFTLSGRIEGEELGELQRLLELEPAGRSLLLDLKDVTLVNRDAVKFLASCDADNITLRNCSAYIREWIEKERVRATDEKAES